MLLNRLKNKLHDEDKEYNFIPSPYHYMKLRDKNNERYKELNRYLFEETGHPINKRVFYELALHLLMEKCNNTELYALLRRFNLIG